MIHRGTTLLSFLDVLCSALGAVVLLAVIFSIVKHPVPQQVRGHFILVDLQASSAASSVGLIVKPPNGPAVGLIVKPPNGPARAFREGNAGRSGRELGARGSGDIRSWTGRGPKGQTHFYLEVRDPERGQWLIRPYLADWPAGGGPATLSALRIWTRDGLLEALEPTRSVRDPAHYFSESYAIKID